MSLRTMFPRLRAPITQHVRLLSSSTPLRTTAGYGDPQDEKMDNHTPTPASTPDPQPQGQGKGVGQKSGTTDPEIGQSGKKEGVAGEQEIRETKKIGEEPKQEQDGGAPIGG
jgi:hypothetical protein